ncbi:unnamed protein product [Rotaria sp. Silwood1]|nr:unnamed protein product [Rotaria sp. Silwood1]CAF3558083.1 unnamed protein product [Rotaria sp. Silwood1]CAF3595334.1 unnamed protein product [Rotaria sp. Silwood1]CAF4613660.1 unnamed protein product [Rotaria sp. Silwood1]CAF4866579.1 unnamed protein product [Rotaria sp. Silwood1]
MAEAQLTNQLTRIDSMTNVELRAELKRRGCPTSGNKKDLLAKLRVALQKEYEQTAVPNSSNIDSTNFDGRNNNLSGLQQSPVVRLDANRPSLDNSTTSSNTYMTPHSGSPIVYSEHIQSAEVPLTYTNLQIHDQTTGQQAPVYNLKVQQNIHQSPAPMIPVPQQLTISPSERSQIYDQSLLYNQQKEQEHTPMHTRQKRTSVDNQIDTSMSSTIPLAIPEKRSRTRSKKTSVDSQQNEIQQSIPSMENLSNEIINTTPPIEPTITDESIVINASTSDNNGNNIEVNPIVSKSNEEEQKDRDNIREEREDSRSPSVGSSSAKSESVIKEIPLSGERHRLSRSKSPKSRWRHSPSPQQQTNQSITIEEEANSVVTPTNDDNNTTNEQVEKSSSVLTPVTEEENNLAGNENKQDEPSEAKNQETTTKNELLSTDNQQPEKAAPQQQLKPSRSQTSSSSSSASLMKGLNRSTTSNRMNLSSDVLKTLIPDISLAPVSVINDELEASINEQDHGDDIEHLSNQPVLETSVSSGFRLSDSLTIGELADQKQQRNRTVVIDVAVDSSSLNDDLVGNSSDSRKKIQAPAPPARIASFESKTLLDGKTNALMMDEPVRVKDATATLEPPSRILYIRGLTRPFTLPLLKELLSRFGKLVDGEFWLDKIKSQCFVTYNTLEEAQNAREGLDGCRWPSTNPKTLSVRFGRHDEFEFSKTHDLPPDQMSIDAMDTTNNRLVQEKPTSVNKISTSSTRRSVSPNDESKVNKKVRPTGNTDVREWDLPKFQEEKEKSPTERKIIEESKTKSNEPPPKGLDDYFRKTKAKPAIYWLPLTEEQIIERTRQQQQRNAERDEEQRKRQLEENARASNNNKDSKPRTNNNDNRSTTRTHRRSPSPKEKRRRISSSPSPRARDNKRH